MIWERELSELPRDAFLKIEISGEEPTIILVMLAGVRFRGFSLVAGEAFKAVISDGLLRLQSIGIETARAT